MGANLHPNPLSGMSEDYPDPENDIEEPDAVCADCGDDVFAEDRHVTECFERFGAFLCEPCFNERCEDDDNEA